MNNSSPSLASPLQLDPTLNPAQSIQLLALDVDGVLTDGSIYIDDLGHETKRFNVRDGFGIRLWQRLGFTIAIITGRSGHAVQHRMKELDVGHLFQGVSNKAEALSELVARTGLQPHQIAYLGDDWPDLCIMRRVGYPMAVADADQRVRQLAAFITEAAGGQGAVRQAIDHLIQAKGLMEQALELYH
jgi:3-deoxy-D-manno-octulosonate 8-phosphate phosphatase (KDO 8-P phosphatase)